ncbi:MAG TPA: PQQ-binding-like beta-propeller repeat protein [Actinomycetota bacterium]|nr:PQQ-binding-like beta-propeller repeat protein [Actinomycetota bacterium]
MNTRLQPAPKHRPQGRRQRPPPRRPVRRQREQGFGRLLALLLILTGLILVWRSGGVGSLFEAEPAARPEPVIAPTVPDAVQPTVEPRQRPWRPQGPINRDFPGLTTFRGNATRSYYGEGPLPKRPSILWRYPRAGKMCMLSENLGTSKLWCGTGWTGQPNVIPNEDGGVEVRFGAYDGKYHFLNGRTGATVRPALKTGDLAKGSATSDPDGYPLYYAGSRDNRLRVVALDRATPTVLWSLDANRSVSRPVWNDDWDGAPLVIGDYLLEGGENSWFYVIRLNRRYNRYGYVEVNPRVVMRVPGYDRQLFRDLKDRDVSIESSVAFRNGVAYFANSGGLVQGWDISDVLKGGTRYRRVFRYWVGDNVDASVVIDRQGYLYVARHAERNVKRVNPLADSVGTLIKLDPRNPRRPLVWSAHVGSTAPGGGILSTPALYDGVVYVTEIEGGLFGVDHKTGKVLYGVDIPAATWMSPVPTNNQLLIADCGGMLRNFDISEPRKRPKELWTLQLPGCIESTPAVWKGMIWLGTRDGAMYAIGEDT